MAGLRPEFQQIYSADIAQTIAEYLDVPYAGDGESFLALIR